MATTAITPTKLEMNVASIDTDDQAGTTASSTTDGWVIAVKGSQGDRCWLKFVADASGGTITIKAGARPPSQEADLGDLTITLAASDVKYVCVDIGRFGKATGSITAIPSTTALKCSAFFMAGAPHTPNP